MMKILVVGGYGLVGTEVYRYLKRQKFDAYRSHHRRIPYGNGKRVHINLLNESTFGLALSDVKPDVVYLCAAYTNVDKCEIEPYAFDVNLTGTLRFVEECQRRDIRVVFYSSSYVFDGAKGVPYTEDDYPRPINRYGSFKLEVEGYVLNRPDGLVIRTIGVFGDDNKNFRSRVLSLRDNEILKVPTDQIVNPIHAKDLAEWSVNVERLGVNGIMNIAGSLITSKYNWARRIRIHNHLSIDNIEPLELPQLASRPKMGALNTLNLMDYVPESHRVYPELAVQL